MVAARSIRRFLSPAAVLLTCGILHQVDPATLLVDDDGGAPYASIQAAIDDAVPGEDDVQVNCGTYYENIVLRDPVSVRGRDAGCAIIHPVHDDIPVPWGAVEGTLGFDSNLTERPKHLSCQWL
jgi:hypothetical protein